MPDTAGLARPGLCAWWVDGDGAAQLSRGLGSGLAVEADLIYVGQAEATEWPSGRRSVKTLATRVVAMDLNGHVRSSDLRLSLAAMLLDELGLAVMRPMLMTPESEDALSAWMKRHLCVAMHPVEDRDTLEDLERRAESALLDPPLNLQRRPDTAVRRRLIELRRRISQEET